MSIRHNAVVVKRTIMFLLIRSESQGRRGRRSCQVRLRQIPSEPGPETV